MTVNTEDERRDEMEAAVAALSAVKVDGDVIYGQDQHHSQQLPSSKISLAPKSPVLDTEMKEKPSLSATPNKRQSTWKHTGDYILKVDKFDVDGQLKPPDDAPTDEVSDEKRLETPSKSKEDSSEPGHKHHKKHHSKSINASGGRKVDKTHRTKSEPVAANVNTPEGLFNDLFFLTSKIPPIGTVLYDNTKCL